MSKADGIYYISNRKEDKKLSTNAGTTTDRVRIYRMSYFLSENKKQSIQLRGRRYWMFLDHAESVKYSRKINELGLVVLKVWSLEQQHQHCLETS